MTEFLSRRGLVGGLAAFSALFCVATADELYAEGLADSYRAEGRNPDGSAYSGTVQIHDQDGVVRMQWQVGSQQYAGSGQRNGDVVWINWGQADPVVYVVMPSGELHGTWANGRGLERLVP